MKRLTVIALVSVLLVMMTLGLLALQGCSSGSSEKQSFVNDEVIALGTRYEQVEPISSLDGMTASLGQQSEEERNTAQDVERAKKVLKQTWDDLVQFAASGYQDIAAAKNAQMAFDELIQGEQEAIKQCEVIKGPDSDAIRINDELLQGLKTATEADRQINDALLKAPDQSVEERKATSDELLQTMPPKYAKGLQSLLTSCDELLQYIQNNSLSGSDEVLQWKTLIEQEIASLKTVTLPQ